MSTCAATKTTPRVLIIGGGLGGLALAQGLKQAKPPIPFHIFERDASSSFRAQGYRIRIFGEVLQKLLPPSLFSLFTASCASLAIKGHAIDAVSGKPDLNVPKLGPPPKGAMSDRIPYNVDRTVLRNVLLRGLDKNITFGKRLEKYHVVEDVLVEAVFSDGSVERRTLLVGADGIRSGVRRQLLPNMPIFETGGRSIFGKTALNDEIESKMPKELQSGMSLIGKPDVPVKLLCEAMRFDADSRELGLYVPADYMYWVLSFHSDSTGAAALSESEILSLSGLEATRLAQQLMHGWHDSVLTITRRPIEDSTAALTFYTCSPDGFSTAWADLGSDEKTVGRPVTLLGDAAHPMPPVGGVGANSAFEDALDLCQSLQSNKGQYSSFALRRYEKSMVQRVRVSMERSSSGAAKFFGMKPFGELKQVSI